MTEQFECLAVSCSTPWDQRRKMAGCRDVVCYTRHYFCEATGQRYRLYTSNLRNRSRIVYTYSDSFVAVGLMMSSFLPSGWPEDGMGRTACDERPDGSRNVLTAGVNEYRCFNFFLSPVRYRG